jgi:hypothetical protein
MGLISNLSRPVILVFEVKIEMETTCAGTWLRQKGFNSCPVQHESDPLKDSWLY